MYHMRAGEQDKICSQIKKNVYIFMLEITLTSQMAKCEIVYAVKVLHLWCIFLLKQLQVLISELDYSDLTCHALVPKI